MKALKSIFILCFFCFVVPYAVVAISHEELSQDVLKLLKEKLNREKVGLSISYNDAISRCPAPKIEDIKIKGDSKFLLTLYCNTQKYILHGEFWSLRTAIIATEDIEKNQVITESLITKKDIKTSSTSIIVDDSYIIGKIAKQHISKGDIIKNRDITKLFSVKKGDMVTVEYKKGVLSVKTTGTSLDSASIKESVRVRVQDSGKIIIAKVVKQGLVEVIH